MESLIHRKEGLIISTIELIDELGIQNLSTREIAKRQNVSEATIFRHYQSKNALLTAVLDYYSQFDGDIYQSTRLKQLKPLEAIIFLIRSHTEYYENYPAITAIMQIFDVLWYEPDLKDKVKEIMLRRTENLKHLILEAQAAGDIRADIDSGCLTDMISGIVRETCLKWRFDNKIYSLKERTLKNIGILLKSLG